MISQFIRKKSKICIPLCLTLILLSLIILNNHYAQTLCNAISYFCYQLNKVYTFSNVCIISLPMPKLENRFGMIFNETKQIVAYENGIHEGIVNIVVAGSENSMWNRWEIHFRSEILSTDSAKNLRDTAFFVQPTCPGNFHHFFVDEFVPLFSVVASNSRLHPGAKNQIVYRTPQSEERGSRCDSRRTYEGFLRTLYIDEFHDVFYNLPNNTCFREAVFGSKPSLLRHRDVIDHVLLFYNLPLRSNRNAAELFVTILNRRDRRIVNVDEVSSLAKGVGFRNVRIVDFSKKSILDQLQIMSTSNVLIGIQGAGLQWASFMPEGSYLIELAWPNKHWRFYYKQFVTIYDIMWRGVEVQDVRINWTSYERNVRAGVPVEEMEKLKLVEEHPKDAVDNIWKWADIYVQKKEITESLQIAFNGLQGFR